MITLTDIKNFDLQRLDPTRIDLTRLDLRQIDLPVELPEFDLPKFDLPALELPEFDLPVELPDVDFSAFHVERVTSLVRDAAYVGVGAVVVTAQKADERRREMTDQVTTRLRRVVDAVA